MASGFLVLSDGRCFSRRWSAHDEVLRAVANQLDEGQASQQLKQWLLAQLPGESDEEELGYGAWFRTADQQVVVRHIDLRQMTAENQKLFREAAKRAALVHNAPAWLRGCLCELADMVARCERGEPPLSKSDWREVVPPRAAAAGVADR